MEIRNLNTFLKVAALQNFTRAGEALGYSQSNVSAQIRQLESELGLLLFDRIGKTVTLTEYGRYLVPYAQQIVTTSNYISNLGARDKENVTGVLKLGLCESLYENFFESCFENYHRMYPKVRVEVTVDSTASLLVMLKKNLLDFAFLIDNSIPHSECNTVFSHKCSIEMVASVSHPLCSKNNIGLKDLDNQEFVLMETNAPYNVDFMRILDNSNISVNTYLNLQKPSTAVRLLKRGCYLSLLPDYSIMEGVKNGYLRKLKVEGVRLEQVVQFVTHPSKMITPQLEDFVQEMKTEFVSSIDDELS